MRVLDLAIKDLTQLVRDWKAAFFLLAMPVFFTLMFGFVFGGSGQEDTRLVVGLLDEDHGRMSAHLESSLENSGVIRPRSCDRCFCSPRWSTATPKPIASSATSASGSGPVPKGS